MEAAVRWPSFVSGLAVLAIFPVYLFYWGRFAILLTLATMLRGDLRLLYDAKTAGGATEIIAAWLIVLGNPVTVAIIFWRIQRWTRALQIGASNAKL
jgi:hypothetical protein